MGLPKGKPPKTKHNEMEGTPQQQRHEEEWRTAKRGYAFFEGVARYDLLKRLILTANPEKILDVGCGSGYLSHLLKQERPSLVIHGCDIAEAALAQARDVLDVAYQLDLDRAGLPEPNYAFDLVVCSEVLERLYEVDLCLQEIARVLKPDGLLIVTVPNLGFWRFRIEVLCGRIPHIVADERHVQTFNKARIVSCLERAGLRVLTATGWRHRWPWLVRLSPELFSDTLFIQATH